ncbi:hypothetical protein FB446DRAFT_698473, partial [Lentinula raphanica]
MRGFGFGKNSKVIGSRTAAYTEVDEPLPRPPPEEYESQAWLTIKNNPHLFNVSTPINVDRFESLLVDHPNPAFVVSVMVALKEGFWPWANTKPSEDFPDTWDNSWAPLPSDREREFINDQCADEANLGRHSPPFGPDLLPGMYSTPVFAVPKAQSKDSLRLVAHQSAGPFCQNNMVNRALTKGNRLDSL